MNIYYFYDKKSQCLVDNYFLPSIKQFNNQLQPIGMELSSVENSDFGTLGFRSIITNKVKHIIDIIKNNINAFIISDIDIEFFGSIQKYIENIPDDIDMIFQNESGSEKINTGFIYIRPNEKVLEFWNDVLKQLESFNPNEFINEQKIIDKKLKINNEIQYWTFPIVVWNWTLSNKPPDNIVLHHANCATNIADKIIKLNNVRNYIKNNNLQN